MDDSDSAIPYCSRYVPELGEVFAATAEVGLHPPGAKPSHVIGNGLCPRCGHEVKVYHRMRKQRFYGSEPDSFWQYCECQVVHPGTPKDATGCGAVWPVKVFDGG